MKKKRKAFTLTELLVVVVVIASLAAVAIPQYQKVLETRKVGEAESVLSAIRDEQEFRCSLGKDYTSDLSQLRVSVPKSNNFTYTAKDDRVTASTADYDLKILAYRDGRICCSNKTNSDACSKFNYPACDFAPTTAPECGTVSTDPIDDNPYTPDDPDQPTPFTEKPCSEDPFTEKTEGYWKFTRDLLACEDGEWKYGAWGKTCILTQSDCGATQVANTKTCVCEQVELPSTGCDKLQRPADAVVGTCGPCNTGKLTSRYVCNTLTNQWELSSESFCQLSLDACEPGSYKGEGGEKCSAGSPDKKIIAPENEQASLRDQQPSTEIAEEPLTYNAGSTCSDTCVWVPNRCPRSGGGGGGSTGGGGGGGGGGGIGTGGGGGWSGGGDGGTGGGWSGGGGTGGGGGGDTGGGGGGGGGCHSGTVQYESVLFDDNMNEVGSHTGCRDYITCGEETVYGDMYDC